MCQCPEQLVWLELPGRQARLQLGRESMMIQGFPLQKVPSLVQRTEESLMASLGGNMMAATVPLAILLSMFEAIHWRADMHRVSPLLVTENDLAAAWSCFTTVTEDVENDEEQAASTSASKRRRRGRAV